MPRVSLQPITAHNWQACARLELTEDQARWLPANLYSIAETQFFPEGRSRAIYNETGAMVGYALYGRDPFTGRWKICRIMIDAAQQGRGYGRLAMHAIISDIAAEPDGDVILICYHQDNVAARTLYRKLGFVEQCFDETGMITAVMRLERACDEERDYHAALESMILPA